MICEKIRGISGAKLAKIFQQDIEITLIFAKFAVMTESNNTTSKPRIPAIELADTGEWHLIVYITRRSLQAWLRPRGQANATGVELFTAEWEESKDSTLREIENAVYDHPRILEDYSTDIIIETPKTLWVPREVSANPSYAETVFSKIWPDAIDEMSIDDTRDASCLYYLTDGLRSFLQRTFPGTRISCHQSWLVRRHSYTQSDDPTVFIDIRDNEFDLTTFANGRLITCVTHEWKEPTDMTWHLFNTLDLNTFDPKATHITLNGPHAIREALASEIRPHVGMVVAAEPIEATKGLNMPVAAKYCYSRQKDNRK